jgi:serine/threonine-protein kinase
VKRWSGRTLALFVAFFASSASETAGNAQTAPGPPSAEHLFEQGVRLLKEGRYDAACPLLEQAQSRVMGIGVTLYLAECYEQSGRTSKAWREFDRARQLAATRKDGRAVIAARRADALLIRSPKLRIGVSVPAAIDGLKVTDDGATVDPDAWGRARPVDAGEHVVRATAPGRQPFQIAVDVAPGTSMSSVEVPVLDVEAPGRQDVGTATPAPPVPPLPPATPAAPSPPSPPPAPAVAVLSPPPGGPPTGDRAVDWQRITGVSLLGLGAVGVGIGAVTGLEARSRLAQSNANGHCGPDNRCDGTGMADRSAALTDARFSTVGFIGGAACLVGGGALLLTAPGADGAVSVAPRAEARGASMVLQGRW